MQTEIKIGYHGNDKLMYEWSILNGIRHGIQRRYYDNGQLCSEYQIKDGRYHGIVKNWFLDGAIDFIRKWKNRQINGPRIKFNY
jgi:antitoxin component YwqK of YwqJK toxin-antitoxin module